MWLASLKFFFELLGNQLSDRHAAGRRGTGSELQISHSRSHASTFEHLKDKIVHKTAVCIQQLALDGRRPLFHKLIRKVWHQLLQILDLESRLNPALSSQMGTHLDSRTQRFADLMNTFGEVAAHHVAEVAGTNQLGQIGQVNFVIAAKRLKISNKSTRLNLVPTIFWVTPKMFNHF